MSYFLLSLLIVLAWLLASVIYELLRAKIQRKAQQQFIDDVILKISKKIAQFAKKDGENHV